MNADYEQSPLVVTFPFATPDCAWIRMRPCCAITLYAGDGHTNWVRLGMVRGVPCIYFMYVQTHREPSLATLECGERHGSVCDHAVLSPRMLVMAEQTGLG